MSALTYLLEQEVYWEQYHDTKNPQVILDRSNYYYLGYAIGKCGSKPWTVTYRKECPLGSPSALTPPAYSELPRFRLSRCESPQSR